MGVKVCPKCGSTDVSFNFTNVYGLSAPNNITCNKCGFQSFNFPEVDKKDLKRFRENLKK
jgi:predicted nucleic-acid-binding Zn-ribbon protein